MTIGASIYVLVGEITVRAGPHAAAAFLLSAFVVGFTAASFAELSGRIPQAAGKAVCVEKSAGLACLTSLVGLAVLIEAMIAATAIAVGSAGYVAELITLPREVLVAGLIVLMATTIAWGIRESVAITGVTTLVEVAGLLFERLTGLPPLEVAVIAIIAAMNGVVIILIIAARVTYRMAQAGRLPVWIGAVSPRTQMPVRATVIIAAVVRVRAIFTPLDTLTETPSEVLSIVLAVINPALVWFELKGVPAPEGAFTVHIEFPIAGALFCVALVLVRRWPVADQNCCSSRSWTRAPAGTTLA